MKDQILSLLPPDFPWGQKLHYFDCIDSTNTQAKQLAAQGAPHGTVLIADRQTGGRGRLGRNFHSPGGVGVYMSVILRPQCPPDKLMHLTCAAAVAMCDAVEAAAGFRPGIKWTNDLVAENRKLAGILTEMALDSATGLVSYAIIGIGINCCQRIADFPEELRFFAGSLSMIAGRPISRSLLAKAMMEALHQMSTRLLDPSADTMAQYRKDCITLGKEISVVRGDDIRHGTALDVDEVGALAVRFEDGHVEKVNSGEVSIRGLYGYV